MENHVMDLWGLVVGLRLETAVKQGIFWKTKTPPASGASGVQKRNPMNVPDLELPACLLGIIAEAESLQVCQWVTSLDGQLHAMDHIHDRRP